MKRTLVGLIVVAAFAAAGGALAQVPAGDFQVSHTVVPVPCQDLSATSGSFTVTVGTETGGCIDPAATTYTVNATPVPGSGFAGSTPPITTVTTYIGFPSGNFLFANASFGSYTVTVTMTANLVCVPAVNPKVFTVAVGVDDGCRGVPSLDTAGLAALGVLLALGGVLAIGRQRLL